MRRVLLDANALMMPVEVGVRVFDELDRLLGGTDVPIEVARRAPVEPAGGKIGTKTSDDAGIGPAAVPVPNSGSNPESAIESGIENVALFVPRAVVRELENLASGHGTEGTAASVGLDLARERCSVLSCEATHGDDAVLELATSPGIEFVCTNDRALSERLFAGDVPVLCLRGHNQLMLREP